MEALGYDNMCNLQTRLHNLGKQGNLTNVQAFFWDQLRYRTFVDSFHIAKHKCKLCSIQHEEKICCFDANLTKFKEIFAKYIFDTYLKSKRYYTKINDEVNVLIYVFYVKFFINFFFYKQIDS